MNKRNFNNKGEVASMLTIFSMLVIGLGLLVGFNLTQQQEALNTTPFAQEGPQPTIHEGNTQWFDGQATQCLGWFDCTYDPWVLKIELRSTTSDDVMVLATDVTGRTPVGKNIGPSCANRAKGFQVEFDPAHAYTDRQKTNISEKIREETGQGYTIQDGQILLSVVPDSSGAVYYIYDRPDWALGAEDVELYFEYDVDRDPDEIEAHAQTVTVPGGCVQVTPTPSTPTPTGATPTVPTPTEVAEFGCYYPEPFDTPGCTSSSQCKGETERGEPLECFQVSLPLSGGQEPGIPGQPDPVTESTSEEQSDAGLGTATGSCDEGEICRCLPRRCLTTDCTSYAKACLAPTPTDTPTPTPEEVSCTYEALAFIEICDPDAIQEDGSCAIDPENPTRYDATPVDADILTDQWAPLNEKQVAGGRYFTGQTDRSGQEILQNTEDVDFRVLSANPIESQNLIERFRFLTGEMLRKGLTYVGFSDSIELEPGSDPLTADVRINSRVDDASPLAEETYSNFEDAEVRFYFDNENYRVVTNGNKIYSCVNDLKDIASGTDACKEIDPASLNEVHGLTVGCGQEIVYGVTLQKCDFNYDYVFVVDTSSSMTRPDLDDRSAEGVDKLAAVETQLKSFISQIAEKGPNSRVAIAHFNTGVGYELGNAGSAEQYIVQDFTPISDQAALTAAVDRLRSVAKEGTCIECGANTAQHLVENKRGESANRPVVVLLSDGNPNSFPNILPANHPRPATFQTVYDAAETLKLANDGELTLVAIGYGNYGSDGIDGQNFENMIQRIASVKENGDGRWAYSSDPNVSIENDRNINNVVADVQGDLNSCAEADLARVELLRAKDINKDGIINAVDLLLLYDNYRARGADIPEDVNKDESVDALDSSLVIQDLGTVIPDTTADGGLTNSTGIDTSPEN